MSTTATATLRAELREDSPFVAVATPRLSWTVETSEPGWIQASVDLTDGIETITLDGADSVLVAWPFAPLAAGAERDIAVRVRATSGAMTAWSEPTAVTAGFLGEGEWVAQPIGLADPDRDAQPAVLRTRFTIDRPVTRALLLWTALGVAEPEINGAAVSDDILAPGWTAYRDRLVHESVDVTDLLREGENVLGASIAGAWYTEKYGFYVYADRLYGTQPSFLAQLRVTYTDGTVETLAATGDGWEATGDGAVVDSGIYAGEHQDLRRAQPGWSGGDSTTSRPLSEERSDETKRADHPVSSRSARSTTDSTTSRPLSEEPSDASRSLSEERSDETKRADHPVSSRSARSTTDHDATPTWTPVRVGTAAKPGYEDVPVPEARIAPPVRRIESLPVAAVLETPSGGRILDFGQNLVGRLRVRVRGEAGQRVVIRHAEVLDAGELALRPLRNAAATATFDLSGGDDVLESRFSFYGFRYAEITGADVDAADIEAVVLHTDMTRTGWFAASDALIERLHENVVWGMRGNFLSIPTDCPQRDERLGWTGDIQVFAPTASFLYDCNGFLTSWLRDLALEQTRAGGAVPLVVPAALSSMGPLGAATPAAWGDAATVVPTVLFERFGDLQVVAEQYASMRDWVDTVLRTAGDSALWAGMMQLGDWLDPAAPPEKPGAAKVDSDIVATAYLARSLQQVAEAARLLGFDADATTYAAAAERSRAAFVAEYVTPAGRMMSDAPTAYALALEFDLVTDAATRQALSDRLAVLVREGGYRIGTGFVGTPLVADALTSGGHLAFAERLLTQTECPSWLYPVTQGATTVWERWDSLLPDGTVNPGEMTSFNHYALGAVADWLHRTVAGLAPASPGYRRLRIAPRPLVSLDHASARHATPYGEAAVSWHREGDEVVITATVPANTTAEVALPGLPASGEDAYRGLHGEVFEVGSGVHTWRVSADAAPARPALPGLAASLADVIDDPRAYDAFLAAIAAHDPEKADAVRTGTQWGAGRQASGALMFTPPALLADVDAALRAATA